MICTWSPETKSVSLPSTLLPSGCFSFDYFHVLNGCRQCWRSVWGFDLGPPGYKAWQWACLESGMDWWVGGAGVKGWRNNKHTDSRAWNPVCMLIWVCLFEVAVFNPVGFKSEVIFLLAVASAGQRAVFAASSSDFVGPSSSESPVLSG